MADIKATSVLVVDDEPGLRELLSDALSDDRTCVVTAGSSREALDLADARRPDIIIADITLGDGSGLDVIDRLRAGRDIPAVVITGHRDPAILSDASSRHPLEVMLKPLDVEHLRDAVRREMARLEECRRLRRRTVRLRRIAHKLDRDRHSARRELDTACSDLAATCRNLSEKLALQGAVIEYQNALLAARNDDDVFRALFRAIVTRSGPVFGVVMVCDADAELQMAGRFGVPQPDGPAFCKRLVKPVIGTVLADPRCTLMDAGEEADQFDESIRRYLPGVSILAMPLLPAEGEMIGLVAFYRKGEQPFTDADIALAEQLAFPTAALVRKND